MSSLRDRTLSGFFWSLLQNVGGQGITFLVTLILARLLTPKDFGLVAMLAIFIQVSQALVNAGFNQALIQKKDPDEEDFSSVFYINLLFSVALYVLLFLGAPSIASFYDQSSLISLTRVLSLIFVVNAFSYVQEARLTKEMRFKTLMIVHLPSSLIGGVISITMAIMGFGVWSIVALQLMTRLAYAIQIWIYSKWKPLFSFNVSKIKSLFSFGGKLMLSSVLETVYQNIYLVVIGKFFPLTSVGYYQNANTLVKAPSSTISGAISKVAFPAFASIQHDDHGLKQGYKRIIQQLFYWLCPIFILAGVLAKPLFQFVLTAKWLPAVPYFQWLCIVGILFPLNAFNLNIVNVKGRSDIFLKLEIVKKLIITAGIIITVPYGIKALLIFQAINSIIAYVLNSFYSGRFIQYPLAEQLSDILPTLFLATGMGGAIYTVDYFFGNGVGPLMRLIMGFGLGTLLYGILSHFMKLVPYLELSTIIKLKSQKIFSK